MRITCPHCLGAGCQECKEGRYDIFRCPGATIPRIVWELLRDLSLLETGIMPNSGGWLDQPQIWVEALDILAHERAEEEKDRKRHE